MPASSLGSSASGGGRRGRRRARSSAAATLSAPQPVSESRPTGSGGSRSPASRRRRVRSSSHASWSGDSFGSEPSRSAAAAETCGAANEVPIAVLELRRAAVRVRRLAGAAGADASTRLRGIVEKIGPPGAAMSTYCVSRFEYAGTVAVLRDRARRRARAGAPPGSRRTATASSAPACRSRPRRRRARPSTTRTRPRPPRPASTCRAAGPRGSRTPPIERLMTRAPWSTAQRIAVDLALGATRCSRTATTFAIEQLGVEREPGDPDRCSTGSAAISPATNVPWPQASVRQRAADERDRRRRSGPANSGWAASMPGVDHGDLDRRELRRRRPVAPGVVLREVPLLRSVRLGVVEGQRSRRKRSGKDEAEKSSDHGGRRRHTRAARGRRYTVRATVRATAASCPRRRRPPARADGPAGAGTSSSAGRARPGTAPP